MKTHEQSSGVPKHSFVTLEESRELLKKHLHTETTRTHCREVEVIMRKLAPQFNEDPEVWAAAGLLHDIDCDIEKENFKMQGTTAANILRKEGYPEEICHAILAHNEGLNRIKRESKLDFALSAADNISGMIYATALVYPDKKIASVKISSVLKNLKKPKFAENVQRHLIYDIDKIGMPVERLAELAVEAMKEIAGELGL